MEAADGVDWRPIRKRLLAACGLATLVIGLSSLNVAPVYAQRPAWADDTAPTGIREVAASAKQLIPLTTKVRYTTLILLPDNDPVMDVLAGDKENWQVEITAPTIVIVKPAKAGAETNLNLITQSGAVYSFLLREGRPDGKPLLTPDLKVSVTAPESATPPVRKYYTAAEYEAVQASVIVAKTALEGAESRAAEPPPAAEKPAHGEQHFDYGTVKDEKPFHVKAIWHDEKFTYIKTDAKELPALYEIKDNQPAIVNFQVENGVYVVPKVIERAYLAIGKARFPFELRSGN